MGRIDLGEAWTLLEIAQRAEMSIMCEHHANTDAEIAADTAADWYLVQAFPGEDARALRWLARRRFGVFRPMQQRQSPANRVAVVQGWEPVFPGWLFVFCWDIGKMHRRILTCPGVMGIFCDPVSGRPIAVDQPVLTEDGSGCLWPRVGFIDQLRALSWVYDERAPALGSVRNHAAMRGLRQAKRSARKLGRTQRRELRKLSTAAKLQNIWDEETWRRANQLDPGERIALLRRTLTGTADAGGSNRA